MSWESVVSWLCPCGVCGVNAVTLPSISMRMRIGSAPNGKPTAAQHSCVPGRDEVLGPVLDPLDGAADRLRGGAQRDVLAVDRELQAEPTADVVGGDAQQVDGVSDPGGEQEPQRVGGLGGGLVRELATAAVVRGDPAAGLHRVARPAVLVEGVGHHVVGLGERGLDVAEELLVGVHDVAGHVLVQLRGTVGEPGGGADDRIEQVVVDLDQRGGVLGEVAALGHDQRDRLPDVAHHVVRDGRVGRAVEAGDGLGEVEVLGDGAHLGAGEHAHHALDLAGCLGVDARDPRVRHGAAQEVAVEHAARLHVVDVTASAGEDGPVLLAVDPGPDEPRDRAACHQESFPAARAASAPSMID